MNTPEPINQNQELKSKLLGIIVVVVIVAGGLWYSQHVDEFSTGGLHDANELLSSKFAIKDARPESFGDLTKLVIQTEAQMDSTKSSMSNNPAMGGVSMSAPNPSGMGNNASVPPDTSKLIELPPSPPEYTQFTFKYDGSALTQLPDTQGVLKRAKPQQSPSLVKEIIKFLSFGLVDLNKLDNPHLSSLVFTEDKNFGYQANVDLDQGNVYFYQNYTKWPQPRYETQAQLRLQDVIANEDAIDIAERFIRDYGISKEGYGAPIINDQWQVQYANASASEKVGWYFPEQVQVIYPILIDGQKIIDEGGNVYGMSIYIDSRLKKVTSVSDLVTKQFERSSYKAETDAKKILKLAESGGFRNYSYDDPNAKKIELQLGTPTIQMVKMWYSTDNYQTNNELYVPSLIFPVKNWKEANYWRQNIYVPLVTDILNSDNQGMPPVMPLDFGGGAASSGSAGVATPKESVTN